MAARWARAYRSAARADGAPAAIASRALVALENAIAELSLGCVMATADPYRLFRQAEAFHAASGKLLPEPGAPMEQLAPYIANSVFALELYLKCLLMCVKGKYPQVHSVQALFFDLPTAEIDRLRKLHRQLYRAHFPAEPSATRASRRGPDRTADFGVAADDRLDQILAGAKDAFYTARYVYERNGLEGEGIPDVTVVTTIVRGRIAELEPAWPAR